MMMKRKLAALMSALMLAVSCAPASLAEMIVPDGNPGAGETNPPKQVAAPDAAISKSEDSVTVTVRGEEGLAIYVAFGDEIRENLKAGLSVTFSDLAAGSYDLEVDYHEPQSGVKAFRTSVDVAGKPKQVAAPGANVSTNEDKVSVTVTGEAGLGLYAQLGSDKRTGLKSGLSVEFTDLAAGEYDLTVGYETAQEGVSPYSTKVNVAGKPEQVAAPGATVSTSEDKVTVTVTGEAGLGLYAQLGSDKRTGLKSGLSVEFTGLAAGEYDLTVGYETAQEGVSPYTAKVNVAGKPRQVAAPGATVSTSEDKVTVTVTGEAGLEMVAALGNDVRSGLKSGMSVEFTGLAAGEYDLEVDYAQPQGVTPYSEKVTVAGKSDGATNPPAGGETTNPPAKWAAPSATVTTGEDTVTVVVTGEIGPLLVAELGGEKRYDLDSGDTATFTGLAAGEYDLTVNYMAPQDGVPAYTAKVTVTGKTGGETTPPAAGETTPPPGGVEVITPPPASGETTPPAGEQTTPPAGGQTSEPPKTPTVTQIGATVTSGDDWIEIKVTAADNWPVYVAVGNDFMQTANVGDTVRFNSLPSGQYAIEIDYMQPVSGVTPFRSSVELTASYAKEFIFSATGGQSSIDVIVSEASAMPITVRLLQNGAQVASKTIAGGVGKATFDGLAKGSYAVELNYDPVQSGVSAKKQENIAVTGTVKALAITSVTPGENVLAVAGTAHPQMDIALTTTPAAQSATIVRSDANGAFAADIVLQAGTYTQVKATYVADNTVVATKDGSFAVTAPAQKPSLKVDTITSSAQSVNAKTTPGVKVNLHIPTYNYGQTVVADQNGLLKYSLPRTYPKGTEVNFTVFYGRDNAQSYVTTVKVEDPVYNTLEYGDTGDAVEAMTERLRDLGYLKSDSRRYGSTVREAVKTFQKLNNLNPNGVADPETLAKIFSVTAIAYGTTPGGYVTLARGDRGSLVTALQRRLKDLGYYTIAVDGIFGSGTERAVHHFQRINGLPKTGIADGATQLLLYSSSAKAADSASASEYKTLRRSSHYHAEVVPLQRRLKALGYPVGSVDGYFGSRTYRAVREFQKRNGLPVTGVADEATQRLLFSSDAKAASSSSSSSSGSVKYRLLSWGSEGEDVLRLQKALLAKGYKQVRVADGIYGKWTYEAVRAFQKDERLAVDGIAGQDTQNALYGTNY